MLLPLSARASEVTLVDFEVGRREEGVLLSFSANFELPAVVIEALVKGTPLYFTAETEIYRYRWYWRDRRVAHAVRSWRITYQPLTRKYRVSTGGLNQRYDALTDALASLRHSARWKIAEPEQVKENSKHYVDFSFRLDTTRLPRPMQIGIGGQADWALVVERSQYLD